MKTTRAVLYLSVVLLASWASAQGASWYRFDGVGPGQGVNVALDSTAHNNVLAGVYNWSALTAQNGSVIASYDGFCIEIGQTIANNGQYLFDLVALTATPLPGLTTGQATQIEELWTWARVNSKLTSNADAAAVQLAMWEIVYDGAGTIDFTAGRFTTTSGLATNASAWLTASSGYPISGDYRALVNTSDQNQAILIGSGTAVPLPSAVWAGLALLSGGGIVRFRRRRA